MNKIKSSLVTTVGYLLPYSKSPDEGLGQLFTDVQGQQIYGDGKTFADLIPKSKAKRLQQEYFLEKKDPDFDLREFLARHFYDLSLEQPNYKLSSYSDQTLLQYISNMWTVLERRNRRDKGSLIALPYAYIVPGGRFNEQFYWDSYFIMLGLESEGRWDMIEGMIKNFAYMMRKFGHIPNANRTYFLSRSQPPFFSHMVKLLSHHKGESVLIEYLPYLLMEYRFWMKGNSRLSKQKHQSFARLVEMKNGQLLNRYYDNKSTPRPESLREDTETAVKATDVDKNRLYLNLRAGAESGWDFSSRWLMDSKDVCTIHTTDIIPVDLNCLLYQLEVTIADVYKLIKQPQLMRKFQKLADSRASAINTYCWNSQSGFFMDYDFHRNKVTGRLTLAGVFPLFAKIATFEQAESVSRVIEKEFLKPGGLVATLADNTQQWDFPNGWAPLHYIVIQGLRNYGYNRLADEIKHRWITTNTKVYNSQHKLVEKYNMVNMEGLAEGGEYPLQVGFGWTNGVLESLMAEGEA